MTHIALPSLTQAVAQSSVPLRYVVPTDDAWIRDVLLGLDENNMVLPCDLEQVSRYADVLRNVLRRHWYEITRGERLLRWDLGIARENHVWRPDGDKQIWLTITAPTVAQGYDWPTYYIGGPLMHLESVAEGLGETVLAVVYDALRLLPNVLTPAQTLWCAEAAYWNGYESDLLYIDAMRETEGDDNYAEPDIFKRSQFFEAMPEWAVSPQRKLTDTDVRRAARTDGRAAAVVNAVDQLVQAAGRCREFADCSSRDAESDCVSWIAWLRWSPLDMTPRVIDDWAHLAFQGEYIEAATAVFCDDVTQTLTDWLHRMHANARVARALEHVIELIGETCEDQQVRITV